MEDDSIATAPNETHPLLPMNVVEPAADSRGDGSAETAVDPPSVPPASDDVTDDCRSTPPCADDSGVIRTEPKSTTGVESVYDPIINMLKEAEKAANDPDYEEKAAARKFGAIKYNPRNQESSFGVVDYCCAVFGCCALCIEG